VRVRLRACTAEEAEESWPQAATMPNTPGALGTLNVIDGALRDGTRKVMSYFAGRYGGRASPPAVATAVPPEHSQPRAASSCAGKTESGS